jgi:hypothetical protein
MSVLWLTIVGMEKTQRRSSSKSCKFTLYCQVKSLISSTTSLNGHTHKKVRSPRKPPRSTAYHLLLLTSRHSPYRISLNLPHTSTNNLSSSSNLSRSSNLNNPCNPYSLSSPNSLTNLCNTRIFSKVSVISTSMDLPPWSPADHSPRSLCTCTPRTHLSSLKDKATIYLQKGRHRSQRSCLQAHCCIPTPSKKREGMTVCTGRTVRRRRPTSSLMRNRRCYCVRSFCGLRSVVDAMRDPSLHLVTLGISKFNNRNLERVAGVVQCV